MRKITMIFSICAIIIFLANFSSTPADYTDITVFFPDRYMHRLIPVTHQIPRATPTQMAEEIVKIISTKNTNTSFTSFYPQEKSRINVKLQGEIATVSLNKVIIESLPKDRENQKLFIYQLVNSLCSVDGIKYVRFSTPGISEASPFSFYDKNELFSANYVL